MLNKTQINQYHYSNSSILAHYQEVMKELDIFSYSNLSIENTEKHKKKVLALLS